MHTPAGPIRVHLQYEEDIDRWRDAQTPTMRQWLEVNGFRAERHRVLLLPDAQGRLAAVVAGLGRRARAVGHDPGVHMGYESVSCWTAAAISDKLPDGDYRLADDLPVPVAQRFAFGWAYGQYRFERYRRAADPRRVQLQLPAQVDAMEVERLRQATTLARDLINTPANDLTPATMAQAVVEVAQKYGATLRTVIGEELLAQRLPAVHAVGRAAAVAPRVMDLQWGNPSHPKVSLVGKGVCFDSGGLDIKPGASMLLMKKDMGGAAITLALAQLVMDARLPVRLRVVLPLVENAISGNAFRPGDVLQTRKGLTVEVGNTDAEGRLILCDALALADEDQPDLLLDMATLTGAARVALGPELPALFSTDDSMAQELTRIASAESDPLWRLPLWSGYDDELASKVADLNNVSGSSFSGAIIAALFLRRFIGAARHWMHLDLYAWNGRERPGRPIGAEPQAVRALYEFLKSRYQV